MWTTVRFEPTSLAIIRGLLATAVLTSLVIYGLDVAIHKPAAKRAVGPLTQSGQLLNTTDTYFHTVMSLASWYDSITFHFRIFSISALTLTYHDARNQRDASHEPTWSRARSMLNFRQVFIARDAFIR